MRAPLVVAFALAGCGFSAGGGQSNPTADARAIDAPSSADGPLGSDATVVLPDAAVGALCPSTYAPIPTFANSTSRYRFVATTMKWNDAETDCADDATGGELATHLIVLDDAAEKTAMIGGPTGVLNLSDQWTGATDLAEEGEVRYVTAQATTLALAPTMQADNKDCIRIKSSGNEEFRSCDEVNRYVCECDGRAADPARFPNPPDGNGGP